MNVETLFRVAALNTEYANCIDADRLEEWPGLFLEQCLYKITTADNHRRGYAAGIVYADSRAMLTDRVAALREANIYERQSYRHIVGMPALHPGEAGSSPRRRSWWCAPCATAAWTCSPPACIWIACAMTDGRLRFAERIVVCDSSRIDTLLAIPL